MKQLADEREAAQASAYRDFWKEVGSSFPDLSGAASTRYYFANERRLFEEHLPELKGLRVFKTDLWDEAKNTHILHWAHRQGALTAGVDISPPTVWQAVKAYGPDRLIAAVADVRQIPFKDESFDAIYSMGTIEHFLDPETALREMHRILRPGGTAIVGVPNLHDPFLRPLMVAVMGRLGLYSYGYGYEKAFSRRALDRMLREAGFEVVAHSGILFMPGWLRILDLACHTWCRPLSRLTGAAVWPFAFLDRHIRALRRHGYLIVSVGVKRAAPAS